MNSTNYKIEELLNWRNSNKPYDIGLQLFINFSTGTHNTAESLRKFRDPQKLVSNIDWLISELKKQSTEVAKMPAEVSEKSSAVNEKIDKLNTKFIFIQRELSAHHNLLKSLKTSAQRLSLIQTSIIPLDNEAMQVIERIQSLTKTGKDIVVRKKREAVLTPQNNTAQMKRYLQIPSVISKTKKRIAQADQKLKTSNNPKEDEKIMRSLIKARALLESQTKEYNDLKKLFKK